MSRLSRRELLKYSAAGAAGAMAAPYFIPIGVLAADGKPDANPPTEPPLPRFKKLRLTDKFYAEGAYYADFNKDGKMDVVAGPFWYEGPDFQKRHEIRPPTGFRSQGLLGQLPHLRRRLQRRRLARRTLRAVSPARRPIGTRIRPARKALGSGTWPCKTWATSRRCGPTSTATAGPSWSTTRPATWATPPTIRPSPTSRGSFTPSRRKATTSATRTASASGDINGDGRVDIVEANGWWEQPANAKPGEPWIWHPFKFAEAGAQMFVYDVDGDGLNDIITAWHCHHYGLVWYKQIRRRQGEITWQQHVILPPKPDLKSDALRISQMHAMDLVDMNGDGLKDISPANDSGRTARQGDVEPDAPAVLYWFELRRDKAKGVQFIPHLIDDDSGVGTQVTAVDLNGDGIPDVIVSNKKGTFLHLSQPGK